jgi:hypothetical protein
VLAEMVDLEGAKQETCKDIEQKYIFLEPEKDGILDWLSSCMVPEQKYYSGYVFSIYYDTPYLDLYYEKRHSDYLKSKVRLRWYSDKSELDPDQEVRCFLELKRKYGILRQKSRIPFSLASGTLTHALLLNEEIANAPLRIQELAYTPPNRLVPILLVQYQRYRFVDPQTGSRIALDGNIRCTHVNSTYISGFPPVHLDMGVLEIKGAERQLPHSLNGVSSSLTREAFSKYARCCEHLMLPLSRRL